MDVRTKIGNAADSEKIFPKIDLFRNNLQVLVTLSDLLFHI
jgi:hypothetical protein